MVGNTIRLVRKNLLQEFARINSIHQHIYGFTLIELLIVVSIVAIIATIGLVLFSGGQAKARDNTRKNHLNQLSAALEMYFQKNLRYIDGTPGVEGTCSDADTTAFYTNIAQYFSGTAPKDPSGNRYCYVSVNNGQAFRLFAKLENCDNTNGSLCEESHYNYSTYSTALTLERAPVAAMASADIANSSSANMDTESEGTVVSINGRVFIPPPVATYTYYINTNGVDPNDCSGGTVSSPWKTWQKVKTCALPGSVINLMPGTYNITNTFNGSNRVDFNGQAGNPITLQAQPGYENQVFVYGPFSFYGDYGVVKNIDINVNTASTGIGIYANNFTMLSNKIHDSSNFRCIDIFYPANNVRIDSNEIYRCGNLSNPNGMGIGLETTGGTNVTFVGNNIHDALSGIEIKLGAKDVVVENNYIHDVVNVGIFGSAGTCDKDSNGNSRCYGNADVYKLPVADRYMAKNVIVRNNIIANVQKWTFIQPKGWFNYQIYNNTFYNSQGYAGVEISSTYWEMNDYIAIGSDLGTTCGSSAGRSCKRLPIHSKNGAFKNNIFANWNGTIMELQSGETAGLVMNNNLYYKSGFTSSTGGAFLYNGGYYSLAGMKTKGFDINSVISNPLFVNAGSDFQLTSTSPAINAGASLGASVQYDFKWVDRPQGTSHDIGAYENAAAEPTPTPSLSPAPTPGTTSSRYMFITSTYYNGGQLGGLSGADTKCQQAANSNSAVPAIKGKTFKAWLADDTGSPLTRIDNKSTGPYILPNGTKVADNWTDLTDNTIKAPININEKGLQSEVEFALTNVGNNGMTLSSNPLYHCNRWNAGYVNNYYGYIGSNQATNSTWTNYSRQTCNNGHLLYCIEDTSAINSVITVYAMGTSVLGTFPNMKLNINGIDVASFNVDGALRGYAYTSPAKVTPGQIKVYFTNDSWIAIGSDRNLRVDKINVDGIDYQTEAATTYGNGAGTEGHGCNKGFLGVEWLNCNGYFAYNQPIPTPSPTNTPTPSPSASSTPSPTPAPSPGSTYYISPNGTDSSGCNGGTSSNPWRTWRKAKNCISAGATVYFKAGTYDTFGSIFEATSNEGYKLIDFNRNGVPIGNANAPITIKPAPGAEGQVTFQHYIYIRGKYGVISGINFDIHNTNLYTTGINIYGSYITIKNSRIHDNNVFRCLDVFYPATNITIDGNEVYNCGSGKRGEGLETTGGVNVTFKDNHIHHTKIGIVVKMGSENVTIEGNRIHNITTSAIMGSASDCSESSNYACVNSPLTNGSMTVTDRYQAKNVIVKNNVIYNIPEWPAVSTNGWKDYQIYNNTFYNVSNNGWATIYLSSGAWAFSDNTALNYCRTHSGCYACKTPHSNCVKIELTSKNGSIKNNIVANFKNPVIDIASGNGSGLQMSNNLYSKTPSYNGFSSSNDTNSFVADPKFTNSTSLDFSLQNSSPAINEGAVLSSVANDIVGTSRPQGSGYDIGAYEHP